jgi:hypothetical protein
MQLELVLNVQFEPVLNVQECPVLNVQESILEKSKTKLFSSVEKVLVSSSHVYNDLSNSLPFFVIKKLSILFFPLFNYKRILS